MVSLLAYAWKQRILYRMWDSENLINGQIVYMPTYMYMQYRDLSHNENTKQTQMVVRNITNTREMRTHTDFSELM